MTTTRRSFALLSVAYFSHIFGLISFSAAARATGASARMSTPIKFSWELSRSFAKPVSERLGLSDKNITAAPNSETDRGLPIIVIIIGVVALIALVKEIINVYRDLKYGGLIVQDKGGELVIKNDPRLPGHVIIVKDRRGVTIHELSGELTTGDVLKALPAAKSAP